MENTTTELQPQNIKPRKPLFAFLLSLLVPGMGQVYNGQLVKGIILFVLLIADIMFFGILRTIASFYGLMAFLVTYLSIIIYSLIDAVIQARRQQQYIPKPYNTWYYHLLITLFALIVLSVWDPAGVLGVGSYRIPTPSGEPTIQLEDVILVDKKIKDHKFTYGDLVTFKAADGETYVKRIVGLPNDRLAVVADIVTINGHASESQWVKTCTIQGEPGTEWTETLHNGHKHSICRMQQPINLNVINMDSIKVPADCYYMMGDNRDNSMDSRYTGPVKCSDIRGLVLLICWGKSSDRININLRDK